MPAQTTDDSTGNDKYNPIVIVLSGPSGVGKDLLLSRLHSSGGNYHFTITATTRAMRADEQEGVPYHFVSKTQFEAMIADDALLEWANVYGNYYGIPKSQVADALSRRQDVILKIDVQGAATVRKVAPDALFIFLAPPSADELARRLRGRGTEDANALQRRINHAHHEMQRAADFDYTVIHETDGTNKAVREIEAIIRKERERRIAKNRI
ncbi:MAG: guanylate kinase [Chloroflexi bacterium]|nr:guanylate kinase [Chloroflexota bacterium]